MHEYEPELVVDKDNVLPDPFDPNVAALKIWTDTNDPTHGYDVLLSASVGTDVVSISVDGQVLEVQVKILQAEVALRFSNCSISYGPDYLTFFGQNERFVEEQTSVSERVSSNAKVAIGAKFDIQGNQERENSRENQFKKNKPDINFEHHALSALRFGDWQAGQALSGQYVPHYRGWSITSDDSQKPSAVLAALRVKKNWLEFDDFKPSPTSRIGKLYSRIASSESESDKLKSKYFRALVKELALKGLHSGSEESMATLALSGFVVRPKGEADEAMYSDQSRRKIRMPEALLLATLNASTGAERLAYESALRAAGASSNYQARAFTPQSGYIDAQRAYFDLCIEFRDQGKPFKISEITARFGEAVIADLRALGAISSDRRNTAYFVSPYVEVEPNYAFEVLARSQETVRLTEDLLLLNPHASPQEVGEHIGGLLGRDWKIGSAKRYGGQLKNWARRRQNQVWGRDATISGEVEILVLRYADQGRTPKEIANLLNVNPETVRRFFRNRKS